MFSYSSPVCTPEQCLKCQDFGTNAISSYNCEGECGLCDLCVAKTKPVPECDTFCSAGKSGCTAECEQGKKICLSCSVQCGVY